MAIKRLQNRVVFSAGLILFLCILWPGIAQSDSNIESPPMPRIALIIDDLGNVSSTGMRIANFEWPVVLAVLPHTPYAVEIAQTAHRSGKEVILHLPLQAVQGSASGGAGSIRLDTSRSQLNDILDADLSSVPFIVGVNNHMGSLITRHPGHMRWLMSELKSRGSLFFVDSYTTTASVALQLAREQGVPATRRDVFLDNEASAPAIDKEFQRLKKLARERGTAVGIGHPHLATIRYLEQALPRLKEQGFQLVSISELIAAQSEDQ